MRHDRTVRAVSDGLTREQIEHVLARQRLKERHVPLSADDYEMSIDGVTVLSESIDEYDVDPVEVRDQRRRGVRANPSARRRAVSEMRGRKHRTKNLCVARRR